MPIIVASAPAVVTVPADVWQQILAALAQLDDNKSCPTYAHAAYTAAKAITA